MSHKHRIVLLVVFLLVPFVNFGLPWFLGAENRFADDVSTRVDAAGYAFAIWGVIFTGMLGFSLSMFSSAEPTSPQLDRAAVFLSLAGIASILFVPISIYGSQLFGWIDVVVLHLIPLLLANWALRKHVAQHPMQSSRRWWYFGPSMYLGWISAASVISTAMTARELQISVSGSVATTIAVVIVAILVAVAMSMTMRRDPIYGGTVCWALIAVGVEQAAFPSIRYVAWCGGVLIAAVVVWRWTQDAKFYAIG